MAEEDKTTTETAMPDPSEWQELAKISTIITTRAESDSPSIPKRMRVKAMLEEARTWVTEQFIRCLAPLDHQPIPEVKWSSLYTTGTVRSKTDPQFSSMEVQAAYNLFGGDSIATYHPAVCPILEIQQIQNSLILLQEMSIQETLDLPLHPLSISELCRVSGRPITCYVNEGGNMIIHILNIANADPADTRIHKLLTAIEDVADGNHVRLNRFDDGPVSAIITIRNAQLFLEQGAVYQRAKRHDKYYPPQSSLMIPYSVNGDIIILQMGFEAAVNPFSIIQSFLPALEGANVILQMALNRAFNSEETLSKEVKRILRSLMDAASHDINTQLAKISLLSDSNKKQTGQMIKLIRQLVEGKPIEEILSTLTPKYSSVLELIKDLKLVAGISAQIAHCVRITSSLNTYLLRLGKSRTGMAKLRTVKLLEGINFEIQELVTISDDDQKPVVDTITNISSDIPWALEFSGGLAICVRNLVGNAIKAWQSSRKETEKPLVIKVIVTEKQIEGTGYYQITVVDNGQGIEQAQIASILDDRVQQVESLTGTGRGLKNVRAIVEAQAPNAPVEEVFTVTNGIPKPFLTKLPESIQDEVKYLTGACVSFLIPRVAVNP